MNALLLNNRQIEILKREGINLDALNNFAEKSEVLNKKINAALQKKVVGKNGNIKLSNKELEDSTVYSFYCRYGGMANDNDNGTSFNI